MIINGFVVALHSPKTDPATSPSVDGSSGR